MKTINIAPTWAWTMGIALQLLDDKIGGVGKRSAKARDGFVAEVSRLGDDVVLLL